MISIIFGLPATGKSYFGRKLASEIDAVYLNTDVIRQRLGKEGEYDDESRHWVYEQMLKLTVEHMLNGRDVVVDGTFSRGVWRSAFAQKAEVLHHHWVYIEMQAGEPTVVRRLKSDRKYSEADYEVYQDLKKEFESHDAPHLILYSDEQTLSEMLQIAKEYING